MIIKSIDAENQVVLQVAKQMATAARTAPKANGDDSILTAIVTGDHKLKLAKRTQELGKEYGWDFMVRDAKMIKHAPAVLLIGVKKESALVGPVCGFCGFKNCGECKAAGANCALKVTDIGIAVGSAVSVAADNRIDNRVFFSGGRAALDFDFFDNEAELAYAIPLSANGKSVFFDRIGTPQLEDLEV
ncbi:MAG: DUF2148 domain-containing protein [Anaerovoracaceae bacterium]